MTNENRSYVLLTREVLVAEDMALTILDLFPAARVLKFHDLATLQEALPGMAAVDTAFLEAGALGPDREQVVGAMTALGAAIVLLGAEDSTEGEAGPQWRGLPLPFDTAMLHQRLT